MSSRTTPVKPDGSRPMRVLGCRSVDDAPRTKRWMPALAVLAAVPLVAERALLISRRTPTAADETLYLVQALDWLGRLTKVSIDAHRTRGVPALIFPVAAATDDPTAYRILFGCLSLVLCGITYLIGREFMGRVAAGWAALMFGLSSTMLLGSVQLLPDMPAAIGVAAAFLLYWRRVVHAGPWQDLRGLWPIGIAVASVFFFNIAFAAFAGVTITLDFLIFRRRDLFRRATLGAGVALGVVLAPHFIKAFIDHGDPTYPIRRGLRGVGDFLGGDPGYVTYARWFFDPTRFFNRFWGIAVIAGVVILALALVRETPVPRRDAWTLGLWLTVPTLATAFMFHAEPRYMLPWMPAVFLTLALPVEWATRSLRGKVSARPGIAALVAVLVAGVAQFGLTSYAPAANTIDDQTTDFRLIHRAAERLGDRLASPPCLIFTRFPREFELHTGCKTVRYNNRTEATILREANAMGDETFFVWWRGLVGDEAYQPSFLDGLLREHAVLAFEVRGPGDFGPAFVYRFFRRE